jgi:protein-S-isoprenylcysteine O-methyltransferase Ste14
MISRDVVSVVVVGAGVLFIGAAQVARGRAIAQRGASVRIATGVAQWLPYFFWVPYAVAWARIGPEIDVGDMARALGLALCVGGVGVSLWAVATLGRHYDVVLEIHAGHEIVRSGPFALVRHPVYTGLAVHFIGACIATGNLLLFAGTLLVTLQTFWIRARAEEQLLRGEFGAEYDRYARDVPMLVPGAGRKR